MRQYELLYAPFVAWIVAQGLKYIISLRKDGLQVKDLYTSGGFPSSHTATVIALAGLYGLRYGIDQPLFACMAVLSALVMYDSVGVRRSTGEQGSALRELASKTKVTLVNRFHSYKGHSPAEVLGGVAVGFAVAITFYLFV
jgi:acid phosphatase family membrane protein YuiD